MPAAATPAIDYFYAAAITLSFSRFIIAAALTAADDAFSDISLRSRRDYFRFFMPLMPLMPTFFC